jgi:hypothetical protein
VAYQSSEAGHWDVYVLRRADSKRTVLSRAGGSRPMWNADGSSLFYRSGRELMRVSFAEGGDVTIGPPERVATLGDAETIGIDRAGRVLIRREPVQPTKVILALHWLRELRQLLGPPPAFVPR